MVHVQAREGGILDVREIPEWEDWMFDADAYRGKAPDPMGVLFAGGQCYTITTIGTFGYKESPPAWLPLRPIPKSLAGYYPDALGFRSN